MRETDRPMGWEDPGVAGYVPAISLKIPGYREMHAMTAHLMSAQLQPLSSHADVLIVGAGGGQELIAIGGKRPDWTFTGVDTSEQMLQIARQRCGQQLPDLQASFVHGGVSELARDCRYDAASCMLVLHFLKGNAGKIDLLQQIARRLKPGAPFFLACLSGMPGTAAFEIQMRGWKSHMLDNGISNAEWDRFEASIGRESDPVSEMAVEKMLSEAGFASVTTYFSSYLIKAWLACKAGDPS